MSSRSLATARARRAGENAPPVSGNRPITSIGSQAAFVQQMPPNMGYNMPPPPNNVRTARGMNQQQQQKQETNGLPFNKLSVSDAIGLVTLRLGRVEQWIIETDHENEINKSSGSNNNLPDGHRIIDNATLSTIINRLDSLEKKDIKGGSSEDLTSLTESVNKLSEQFNRMSADVNKHTIELAKNSEQIFRFNRDLVETKDL